MLSIGSRPEKGKPPEVNQSDKAMLRDLLRIGPATPTKFEVRTNRIGTNVQEELDRLYHSHLIGKKSNSNVYYPTARTLWKSYV